MKMTWKKAKKLNSKNFFKKQIGNFIISCSEQKISVKPTSLFFEVHFYNGYLPYANIMSLVNEMEAHKDPEVKSQAENALLMMFHFLNETMCHTFPQDEKGTEFLRGTLQRYFDFNKERLENSPLPEDVSEEELAQMKSTQEAKEVLESAV